MAKVKVKGKTKKFKTVITPDGIAAFAHLNDPDETFKPTQCIDVHFDPKDKAVKTFFKLLKACEDKWRIENGKKPKGAKALAGCIKLSDAKLAKLVGVKEGAPYIKFGTKPKKDSEGNWIPVPVVGANGKKTNTFVYGTDLVSIETTISGWTTPQGLGIKCYLSAVQLLESRYEGGRGKAGKAFGVRDDFLVDEDSEDAPDIEDDETLDDEDIDLDLDDDFVDDDSDGEDDNSDEEDDDPTAGLV